MRPPRSGARACAALSWLPLSWLLPACAVTLPGAHTLLDEGRQGFVTETSAAPQAADAYALAGDQASAAARHAAREIVYSGELRIGVASPEAALEASRGLAADLGGWVQLLTRSQVTLRVPADRFAAALERVGRLGRVLDRRIESSDVTEQVVDLRLRLKNALALRDRLAALLDKADTVAVALQVETELTRVRTEIEQLEGRLLALEHQVAFSTLTLDFVQAAQAPRSARLPFAWLGALGVEALLGGQS